MVCRHKPGDPDCSSSFEGRLRDYEYSMGLKEQSLKQDAAKAAKKILELEAKLKEWEALAGNNYGDYNILDHHWENGFLIMMVQYPSCKNCSFESKKILVFDVENPQEAIYWRKVDPHFRETSTKNKNEAPSPIARFPATDEGWINACKFVRSFV